MVGMCGCIDAVVARRFEASTVNLTTRAVRDASGVSTVEAVDSRKASMGLTSTPDANAPSVRVYITVF